MQYLNKTTILFLFLCLICFGESKYKTNISIFNEGIHIPISSGFMSIPMHPGISLGLERRYNENPKNILFQNLNLGLYLHNSFEHGLYLNTETGYRHIYKPGIQNEILIGLGYLHTFSASRQYELNNNGEFEEINTKGRPHLMISASLGLGYDFGYIGKRDIMIYLRYQPFIELPYASDADILLMMHTSVHLGMVLGIFRR